MKQFTYISIMFFLPLSIFIFWKMCKIRNLYQLMSSFTSCKQEQSIFNLIFFYFFFFTQYQKKTNFNLSGGCQNVKTLFLAALIKVGMSIFLFYSIYIYVIFTRNWPISSISSPRGPCVSPDYI